MFPNEQFGFFLVVAVNKPSLFCDILHSANSAGVVATRLWIVFIDFKAA
jgi:hypothetical protein